MPPFQPHRSAAAALLSAVVCAIAAGASQPAAPGNLSGAAPVAAVSPMASAPRQDDRPAPGALSARNANYDIEARLDHAARTITGTEVVRWRNIGLAPTSELFLHLYWNGWRNDASTWMREARLAGDTSPPLAPADWSYLDLTLGHDCRSRGGGDRPAPARHLRPSGRRQRRRSHVGARALDDTGAGGR